MYLTGERCALALDALLQGRKIYKAFREIPFLMPLTTQSTNTEPCKSIFRSWRIGDRSEVISMFDHDWLSAG